MTRNVLTVPVEQEFSSSNECLYKPAAATEWDMLQRVQASVFSIPVCVSPNIFAFTSFRRVPYLIQRSSIQIIPSVSFGRLFASSTKKSRSKTRAKEKLPKNKATMSVSSTVVDELEAWLETRDNCDYSVIADIFTSPSKLRDVLTHYRSHSSMKTPYCASQHDTLAGGESIDVKPEQEQADSIWHSLLWKYV